MSIPKDDLGGGVAGANGRDPRTEGVPIVVVLFVVGKRNAERNRVAGGRGLVPRAARTLAHARTGGDAGRLSHGERGTQEQKAEKQTGRHPRLPRINLNGRGAHGSVARSLWGSWLNSVARS